MTGKDKVRKPRRKPGRKGAWHRDVAYGLGRAAGRMSSAMRNAASSAGKEIEKAKKTFEDGYGRGDKQPPRAGRIRRIDRSGEPADPRVSPILREIGAIMDISGLTDAIKAMNEIGLKHSKDSVVAGIVSKIEGLPPDEQEAIARKFLEKFRSNALFSNSAIASLVRADISEDDCRKMSDLLIESVFSSLEDVGLAEEDKLRLRSLAGEISRPIDDLVQFYLRPKTFRQKVKRLWRMQRIFIKLIGLINKLNALANDASQTSIETVTVDLPAHLIERVS